MIVTTDARHYKAIAQALRTAAGEQRQFLPADMAAGVQTARNKGFDAGYTEGLEQGYANGEQAAEAACEARHYTTVLPGNGTTELTFPLPFQPDFVCLFGFDPTAMATINNVMLFTYDLRALGIMAGFAVRSNGGTSVANAAQTWASAGRRFQWAEDGTATIKEIRTNTSDENPAVFSSNVMYTVAAVKYTDKTDRERITELVNGLTGSGQMSITKAKVNAAFTTAEWEALIATKPDWTFALFG